MPEHTGLKYYRNGKRYASKSAYIKAIRAERLKKLEIHLDLKNRIEDKEHEYQTEKFKEDLKKVVQNPAMGVITPGDIKIEVKTDNSGGDTI